jgi:nitric oxide reductase NorE protein
VNTATTELTSTENPTHLPGEAGVWIFILGDMLVFGLFFCTFIFYRAHDLELYQFSQNSLVIAFGLANTLLLLTSSLFVALGMGAVRSQKYAVARFLFSMALLCGVCFGMLKFIEYGEKISAGITVLTNEFFMFYYILTGIHFFHVLIGIGVLIFMIVLTGRPAMAKDAPLLEGGACYWHMVDLLWIILFPLLYLMK